MKDKPKRYDVLVKMFGGRTFHSDTGTFHDEDIAIRGGKVVRLIKGIDAAFARQIVPVPAGGIAMNENIDPHIHATEVWGQRIRPERDFLYQGTPTVVDCGSTGVNNFRQFLRQVIRRPSPDDIPHTEILAYLNIAAAGLANQHRECFDLTYLDPEKTAACAREFGEYIIGIKVRLGWLQAQKATWREALRRAIKAGELARLPIMVHINEGPCVDEILSMLRPDDIITHCCHGRGNDQGSNILTEGRRLRRSVRRALKRGVRFDLGHGGGGYSHKLACEAVRDGLLSINPSLLTISTDLHDLCLDGPTHNFWTTMTKVLSWPEIKLETVLQMSSINTARMIGFGPERCTLQVGSPANLTIWLYSEPKGGYPLVDAEKHRWNTPRMLQPLKVLRDGIPV